MTPNHEEMGFDCRIWGSRNEALWDVARRSAYLLNPRVSQPLSVDQTSWPSVFDWGGPRKQMGLDGFAHPIFVGPHAPFWSDLSELEAELSRHRIDPQGSKVVQVVRCCEKVLDDTLPAMVHPGFVALGFDVADSAFVSALTNCGLTEEEMRELRDQFSDVLNEHHLLAHLESAAEYSAIASDLIPEHAPFEPYLLAWRPNVNEVGIKARKIQPLR